MKSLGDDLDIPRPGMALMALEVARALGYTVGSDTNVAMTTGRVCFVANRDWDESCTREASALVSWEGDSLILPPFAFDGDDVSPAPGHDHVLMVNQ